jgi:hypothetical protein
MPKPIFRKTLFIFGAGSSRDYAQASHGIQGFQSPLNRDFFKMLKLVLVADNLIANSSVRAFLRRLSDYYSLGRGANLDFLDSPVLEDLEAVMTHLNIKQEIYGARANITTQGTSMEAMLRDLIVYSMARASEGPVSNLHRRFVDAVSDVDVLISFNYDLLLDKALRDAHRFDDNGYHVTFHSYSSRTGSRPPSHSNATLDLLKLHGSSNWARCVECSGLVLLDDPKIALDLTGPASITCPRCGRGPACLIPLIVPPVQTKAYADDPFRFLWIHAAKRIVGADRIVAIGYRFSNNDRATETFLREEINPNRLKEIHLVNTTRSRDEVEENYKRVFPTSRIVWSRTFQEYLDGV